MHLLDGLAILPHVTNMNVPPGDITPQAEQMDLNPFSSGPIPVFLSYAGLHYFLELRWNRHLYKPQTSLFNDTHFP